MKHRLFFSLIAIVALSSQLLCKAGNTIVAGKEYYLYNIFYDRVLGQKADATPGLSKIATNSVAESYIFVAESSGTDGYYLLRQKSSGKYLTASTSNTYSVVFLTGAGTSTNYLWSLSTGLEGSISSKRSPTKFLGCDTGKESDTYVSVFYDKSQNDQTKWQIFSAENGFENGHKQLYLDVMIQTINKANKVAVQMNYADSLRQKVATATVSAQYIYDNATSKSLAEIIAATKNLQTALTTCLASDSKTLLSGTNFDVSDSYTLAINQLKWNNTGSEFSVLIRSAKGIGVIIEISPDKIMVDNQLIGSGFSDITTPADYQFSISGTTATISRNNVLLGSVSTYSVPAYTTNGTTAEWSLLGVSTIDAYIPEVVSSSQQIAQGTDVKNKYGNNVRYAVFLQKQNLTLAKQIDLHIMNEANPLIGSTINLTNEKSWVILDNTLPSDVINNWLTSFTINGAKAILNQNIRVGIYLNGAVVMPYSPNTKPFTGYSGENYTGDSLFVGQGANELGKNANSFRSFVLKRGYMATLASGTNGSGYSRVYVADHKDILVPIIPQALNRRITSVNIKKWNYVSKKGWCSTTSNAAIATECKKMRATWFYTWSADRSSTYDTEYIPIRGHLYWPSMSQISGQTSSNSVLSFNEPEHSEQHTSDKCSCGGTISAWTACTKTPDFQSTGMRIGSPAPTDASWLTEYTGYCDNMAYRCDFVTIHSYWGTNEAANAASWYSQLKAIYDKTKRPIWITEWNNGASWTTETWPSAYGDKLEKNKNAIKEILNVLDTCRFVERYSIYNWDTYYRAMINPSDGWVTPAGEVYRDDKSTFAYNADVQFTPVWWVPGLKTVSLKAKINSVSGKIEFTITNENADMTDKLIIQRKQTDGTYKDYYLETNRSVFDNSTLSYSFDLKDFDVDNDEFRVYVTTTAGSETYSNVTGLGYLINPNIVTSSKTAVDGWTCAKSAANGFTQATNDTYLEVWDSSPIGMNFNYYQDINDLAEGVYELSAAAFNSTNGIAGSNVNGHVGLYAITDGVEYFTPINQDSELSLLNRQSIPYIAVKNNNLRIGIKNSGEMTARWAGADEFKLRYLGSLDQVLTKGYDLFKKDMQTESDNRYNQLFIWNTDKTSADASTTIVNSDCIRKDTYGWTAQTVSFASGEAFDGTTTNNYWDYWSSTAYNSGMYQDFEFLPEGKYTLSAMLRSSVGANVKLYATVSQNGSIDSTTTIFTGTGGTTITGSAYQKGWSKVTLNPVDVKRGQSLRIGFVANLKNQWWSADHFTLSFTPQNYSGLTVVKNSNLKIIPNHGYVSVITETAKEIVVYNASGILVSKQSIPSGISKINLQSGVYFINHQKILVW